MIRPSSSLFTDTDQFLMGEYIGWKYKLAILKENEKQDRDILLRLRAEIHKTFMSLLQLLYQSSSEKPSMIFKYPAEAYNRDEENNIDENDIPLGFEFKLTTRSSTLTSDVLRNVLCEQANEEEWNLFFEQEEETIRKRESKKKSARKRRRNGEDTEGEVEENNCLLIHRVFAAYLLSLVDNMVTSTKPVIRYIKEEEEMKEALPCPQNITETLTSLRDCDAKLSRISNQYEMEIKNHHDEMIEKLKEHGFEIENDIDIDNYLLNLLDRTEKRMININTTADNEHVKYNISKHESIKYLRPGKREFGSFISHVLSLLWPDGNSVENIAHHLENDFDKENFLIKLEEFISLKKSKNVTKPRTRRLRTVPGEFHLEK